MSYKIDVISTLKSLENFKYDWKQFEKKYFKFEYNYDIIKNWLYYFLEKNNDRFGYDKKILILVIYFENSIKTIFPLIKVRRKTKRFINYTSLEFIGSQFGLNHISQIGEIKEEYFNVLLSWLNENIKYDLLFFSNQDIKQKNKYLKFKKYFYSVYPIIDLKKFNNYEDYFMKNYNSNMRKNLKRREKMLFNDGGELLVKKFNQITDKEFKEIISVSSSKETEGKHDHFKDKEILSFFKSNLELKKNKVILAKLKNKIIGYQFIYLYDKYKIYTGLSYDRNYKKYGIGNLLENYDIKNTDFKKYDYINMGPGLEKYKTYYSTGFEKIFCLLSKGNNFFSGFIFYLINQNIKKIEIDCLKKIEIMKFKNV